MSECLLHLFHLPVTNKSMSAAKFWLKKPIDLFGQKYFIEQIPLKVVSFWGKIKQETETSCPLQLA